MEQVNKRIKVVQCQVTELEAEASNPSDLITSMASDFSRVKKELAMLCIIDIFSE